MRKVRFFELFAGITVLIVVMLIYTARQGTQKPVMDSSSEAVVGEQTHDVWLTDFEKAKETAVAEGKDLLIDFSGSDWCYWCKRLDKEVFVKPEFLAAAGKDFVFVMIDFPRDTSGQTQAQQQRNQQLADQYGIQGFPTVILTASDGTPYAKTGYQEGGVKAYLKHLEALKQQK